MKGIMRSRVQFGISSSALTPWDRITPNGPGLGWEGYTMVTTKRENKNFEFYRETKAWIEIALQLLLPLFRHNLSPIDKLSLQFYIASTLLHEFAHALNQFQDPPMGRSIVRNEPAYGGDENGKGAEVFCELGYSFVKGLLGVMPKILNPVHCVGAPPIALLLSKEIPARKYDNGIFLHDAGEDFAQFEETNKVVPVLSNYFEYIDTDEFWDKITPNFGVSIIGPVLASIVVVEPDASRPELSSYVFNDSKRRWMYEAEAVVSDIELLSSLSPNQRRAYGIALEKKDHEFTKLRRVR
ncbi:adbba8c0-46bf-4ae6-969b-a8a416f3cbb2 [Sclerotinia trifoliorum]|uniref:Adbba8c0-46bf-4ae6-969b-a8a416f3cbb2 n=1 Tax=Sclerotinia trifoliorum TaxID=28548 RepID=A0A8H2VXQ3_9HELO|nr:adbba8c0-46bf-4ae6-969b-a8a416f3cbb2 [Sclerotinia trifoliorum]